MQEVVLCVTRERSNSRLFSAYTLLRRGTLQKKEYLRLFLRLANCRISGRTVPRTAVRDRKRVTLMHVYGFSVALFALAPNSTPPRAEYVRNGEKHQGRPARSNRCQFGKRIHTKFLYDKVVHTSAWFQFSNCSCIICATATRLQLSHYSYSRKFTISIIAGLLSTPT